MQPNDINSPTILLAIELSASTWLVAARVPGSEKPHLQRIDGGDTVALLALISSLQARVACRHAATINVVCCFEAGRDGFWLQRFLTAQGVDTHVLEPTSILINRVVRLASGGDRLTFAGDAVFQVGFEHPDWYNGFEHDPEEAARVRVRLLRELAANRESLVATHLSFPSVCHVAVAGDVFRWVPGPWEY